MHVFFASDRLHPFVCKKETHWQLHYRSPFPSCRLHPTLDWNSLYWNRGKQLFRKGLILQNKNCSLLLTKSKNTALWYWSRKHLFVILLPSTTIKRRSHFWNRKQTWGVQRITTNESNHFDWLTIQTIQVSRDFRRRSGKPNQKEMETLISKWMQSVSLRSIYVSFWS